MQPLNLEPNAPWKQRFRAPVISWVQYAAANPDRGLVCTNKDGIYQLYAWDIATHTLTIRTDAHAGVVQGLLSADGEWIYYLHDEGGNEIGHFVRIPFIGGPAQDISPDLPPYASFFITQCESGRVTGFTAASANGFEMFVVEGHQPPRRIAQYQQLSFGPLLSYDGEVALTATSDRTGSLDRALIAVDVVTGQSLAELWDGEDTSHDALAFSPVPGDMRVLASSSKSGFQRPLIWNPRTGERFDLPIDHIPGEVTPVAWSPDALQVLLLQLHQSEFQLYRYHINAQTVVRLNHPAGVINAREDCWRPNHELVVTWQDSVHPARLIALDAETGEQKAVVLAAGEAPAGRKLRSFTYAGANGAMIQGWIATPEGEGPFPTILETHGGPTWVMSDYFAPNAQTWLDHGFAYCTINYHGSTTFGKAFEKSIWHRLGELEVEDMAGAYDWLVEQQIAMPDSVLITGWSYGGYLTLMGLGKRPDLWAGGMAGIAIADWELMYEDQAETLRAYQRGLFGGTPQEKPEQHRASSPITYAEQVKAPVLVVQGSNDTRCPPRQMRVYESRLNELGKSIQVEWFDAGHGSRAQEQSIEHQELLLRFAYRVLG
jgi:dienelactone hydrolase